MKGKPWTVEKERRLISLVKAHRPLSVIADALSVTEQSVRHKIRRLGLVEGGQPKKPCPPSTDLKLPKELPSVEEALKLLSASLETLRQPGLAPSEVLRLKTIVQAVRIYQGLLADYVDYRGIEVKLEEVRQEVWRLAKKPESTPSE